MSLSYEAAEQLFERGQFVELVRPFEATGSNIRPLSASHRILLGHAFALMGNLQAAGTVIDGVESADMPPLLRSKVQMVLGVVSEASGQATAALEQFQTSIRFAYLARDDKQIAWAQLYLFRHMIDRGSTNSVVAMMPITRQVAIRAGTPVISAYLHECVSVFEGQLGRIAEARRHCAIADSIVARSPNEWLRGRNLTNRACLSILECDFRQAANYLGEARAHLQRSGTRFSAGEVNLGHCQVITGEFERAEATFDRVLTSPRASHRAILGALEGLARLHLATGNLDECEKALGRIDAAASSESALAQAFYIRWSTIAKARLLLKSGRPHEALKLLAATECALAGIDDVPLKAGIHVTMALALTRCGDYKTASTRLLLADRCGVTTAWELQGAYYFTCAVATRDQSPALAHQLYERAQRLWKQQGIVSVPLELTAPAADCHAEHALRDRIQPVLRSGNDRLACALEGLGATLDLSDSPQLIADTLLRVIDATECSTGAHVQQMRSADDQRTAGSVTIPLENSRGRHTTLVCPIPREPQKAAMLSAISKIATSALELRRFREEERNRAALWPADSVTDDGAALYVAEEMQALLATARRAASTDVPLLITGETGTGKEVLARTIHGYSRRPKAPFLPFNCTSTPRDILDSQLFGHRRGSFTGASENFQGIIRAAAGGTLFLDEIGDMAIEVQPKLLRFLESGEIHPVGDTHPVRVDLRVIAATNADLDALVTAGRFREDLFYRLNIVRLHLPPLRERRVEIPALANHYLQKFAQEYGKGDLRLAEETMEYLVLYRWPGNIRQLANEMRRMAALCEAGAVLMPEHLSSELAASRRTIPASQRVLDATEVVVRLDQPMGAAVEHLERAMLQYALKQCGGRMEETAKLLGVSRKGLYLKRQRFGIEPPALGAA